jgi:6-phosphogluconate dehydrogenase
MLLVPAGKYVDSCHRKSAPYLEEGDIVIDGGNTFFLIPITGCLHWQRKKFTSLAWVYRRRKRCTLGPSMMPVVINKLMKDAPVFEAIAAKVNDEPCVAYMGNGSAGHYVKMVHNGLSMALCNSYQKCMI